MYYNITKQYTTESIHKNSKTKIVGIKTAVCVLLILCATVCLWSCSVDDVIDDLSNFVEENVNYEYVVKYSFNSSADVAKVEARLKAFRFTTEEKKQIGQDYEYRLTSHYMASDDYFTLITKNYDVSFVVKETDKNLISKDDIIGVTNLGLQLYVEASERFVKSFYNRYALEDVICRCDGVDVDTMIVDEESNGKYYLSLSLKYDYANKDAPQNQAATELARKAVTYLASDPLESDVEAEIIKSASFYQPSQNS